MGFIPKEGGAPAQVIAHLQRPGAPAQMTYSDIAKVVGKPVNHVPALLASVLKAGLLLKTRNAAGSVAVALPAADTVEQAEPETVAEGGVAAEFECCLWDTGELDLFGLEPIEVNGVAGCRASADSVARLAALLLPLGR